MGRSASNAATPLWQPHRTYVHQTLLSSTGQDSGAWDDMNIDTFNSRYRLSHKHLELSEGGVEIRNEDMAERVAKEMGGVGGVVVSKSTASRWKHSSVPDLATVGAIARVCGVHVGWLTFGEAGGPTPDFVTRPRASDRHSDEG